MQIYETRNEARSWRACEKQQDPGGWEDGENWCRAQIAVLEIPSLSPDNDWPVSLGLQNIWKMFPNMFRIPRCKDNICMQWPNRDWQRLVGASPRSWFLFLRWTFLLRLSHCPKGMPPLNFWKRHKIYSDLSTLLMSAPDPVGENLALLLLELRRNQKETKGFLLWSSLMWGGIWSVSAHEESCRFRWEVSRSILEQTSYFQKSKNEV